MEKEGEGAVWGLPTPQLLPNHVLGWVVLSRLVVSDFCDPMDSCHAPLSMGFSRPAY